MPSCSPYYVHIMLNFACVCLVALPAMLLKFAPPLDLGIRCDDPVLYTQSSPRSAAAKELRSHWWQIEKTFFYFICVFLPITVYTTTETIIAATDIRRRSAMPLLSDMWHRCKNGDFPRLVVNLYLALLTLLFINGITVSSVSILKVLTSRPRPDFASSCDIRVHNPCGNTSAALVFVEELCSVKIGAVFGPSRLSLKEKALGDALLSFPSRRAAVGSATAVFSVLYLQYRFTWRHNQLLRPTLQVLLLGWGVSSAVDAVARRANHPIDAAVGLVLGAAIAYMVMRHGFPEFYPSRDGELAGRDARHSADDGWRSCSDEVGHPVVQIPGATRGPCARNISRPSAATLQGRRKTNKLVTQVLRAKKAERRRKAAEQAALAQRSKVGEADTSVDAYNVEKILMPQTKARTKIDADERQ